MTKSKLRGHDIILINGEWLYSDDMTPTAGNERDCGFCGKKNTQEGHDGCLGTLPNVMNACCGHGVKKDAYIQYCNEKILKGKQAMNKIMDIIS